MKSAMKITLVTIFPEFFPDAFGDGMIRVAREKGRLEVNVVNLRDFTDDPHRTTDDYPFGRVDRRVAFASGDSRAISERIPTFLDSRDASCV